MTVQDDLLHAVRGMYAAIDRFDAAAAGALGVDRTALRAINAMERGSVTPGALGAELGLSSGSVTALLDRLERGGHIRRSLSPKDGRQRAADLTPEARERADRIYDRLGKDLSRRFAQMDGQQVQALVDGLAMLSNAFLAAARPES